MYESTLVKIPSFWYGLKRPACSGRETTSPAAKAAATSTAPRARLRDDGMKYLRKRGEGEQGSLTQPAGHAAPWSLRARAAAAGSAPRRQHDRGRGGEARPCDAGGS